MGLSLAVVSGGLLFVGVLGNCDSWALELGLGIMVLGLNCSAARGIFPDQGWNLCTLQWLADPYPLDHQGGPRSSIFLRFCGGVDTCGFLSTVICVMPMDSAVRW